MLMNGVKLLSGLLLMLAGCSGGAVEAKVVEVRDYQGEKLNSINDFRENSIKGPQKVDSAAYRLGVTGLVRHPLSLPLDRALAFRTDERVVRLSCVEGWSVNVLWQGVHVTDLLDSAGVRDSASTVIFRAVDGYSTSFPLKVVRDRDMLLAHRINNAVLPAARGYPFELVAQDKWGYKWIKWVNRIELSADSSYRGAQRLPTIKWTFDDTPRGRTRAEWFKLHLESVLGVTIDLDPVVPSLPPLDKKEESRLTFILGWCVDYPDPHDWLSIPWHSGSRDWPSGVWPAGNFSDRIGYSNPAFDALLDEADSIVDLSARLALYLQAEDILLDDLPMAPMWNTANICLVKPWVKGLVTTPMDWLWDYPNSQNWCGSNDPLTIHIER